jgi:hypothetical protein
MGQFSKNLHSQIAVGTALTNSTTETALASYTIKGGTLAAGKSIAFDATFVTTAAQSTDTLTLKVYIGSTAIATFTAEDQTTNDVSVITGKLTSRSLAASATVVGWVLGTDADATGEAARGFVAVTGSLDTTADLVLSIKGTWSAQSAADSVQCESFNVIEL